MKLFRLDCEHEDDDASSVVRFMPTADDAKTYEGFLASFGWSIDCYPIDAPHDLWERLCRGLWPNAPQARIEELARNAKAQAAEDLQHILARKQNQSATK